MSYALGQSTVSTTRAAGIPGASELVVAGIARDPAANTYQSFAEALDAMAMATRKYGGRRIQLMSPPGSNRVVADLEVGSGRPRVLHGLGLALASDATYYVGVPGTRLHRVVRGRKAAMGLANGWARATGRFVHIHHSGAGGRKGALLLKVAPRRRYAYKASMMGLGDSGDGLGDTLTDWACSSADFAQSWRERVNDALDTATTAAVIGAAAAGALGGLLGRPLLGAGVGAVTGWAAAAIWTAPQRP
jgi:hypothetical protein